MNLNTANSAQTPRRGEGSRDTGSSLVPHPGTMRQAPSCTSSWLSLLVSLRHSTSSLNLFSKCRPTLKLGKLPLGVCRTSAFLCVVYQRLGGVMRVALQLGECIQDGEGLSTASSRPVCHLTSSADQSTFTRTAFQNGTGWFTPVSLYSLINLLML